MNKNLWFSSPKKILLTLFNTLCICIGVIVVSAINLYQCPVTFISLTIFSVDLVCTALARLFMTIPVAKAFHVRTLPSAFSSYCTSILGSLYFRMILFENMSVENFMIFTTTDVLLLSGQWASGVLDVCNQGTSLVKLPCLFKLYNNQGFKFASVYVVFET